MATTTYFEETIRDKAGAGKPVDLEFGTMTALPDGPLLYVSIDGNVVLVDG